MPSSVPHAPIMSSDEVNLLATASTLLAPYSTLISGGAFAWSAVMGVVQYNQNKEIIKQLRSINHKLDVVLSEIVSLGRRVEQLEYQRYWREVKGILEQIDLEASGLQGRSRSARAIAFKLRYDLSVALNRYLDLQDYHAFDFVAGAVAEIFRLMEIERADSSEEKRLYSAWFSRCIDTGFPGPAADLQLLKSLMAEMRVTYREGTYTEESVHDEGIYRNTYRTTFSVSGNLDRGLKISVDRQRIDQKRIVEGGYQGGGGGIGKRNSLDLLFDSTQEGQHVFAKAQDVFNARMERSIQLEQGIERLNDLIQYCQS